jgi:hypothetical protein
MWEIKSYFTSVLKELEVVFLTNITSISVKAEVIKGVFFWLMNIFQRKMYNLHWLKSIKHSWNEAYCMTVL